jgi:heme-degrading monooxygenase HmoA
MYMRLVRFRLLPGKFGEMLDLYRNRVIPELRLAKGCSFGALTESVKRPDECVSLTLWDSRKSITEYEVSGRFNQLLTEAEPYLAESSEWRVHLSDDLSLTYGPAKEPPKVSAYRLDAGMQEQSFARLESPGEYLRVLRLPIAADRMPEMKKTYAEEVIPALRKVRGCLYAGLLANITSEGQLASMTIWASRSDAEEYERSELYRELMRGARELVGARSWDLMLGNQSPGPDHPEAAVEAQAYDVVVGRHLSH